MAKKTFILHDDTLNTQGFRMLTSGADLTVFRRNPVMLLNHDDWDLPIGRWENIRIEGSRILAEADFDEEDERARKILGKVNRGYLRSASIGAWPPEESSTDPALMLPGQTLPTVTRWTVREASICTIGSNHNALVLYDREGEKIDLTDRDKLIKLFDTPLGAGVNHKTSDKMSILTGILKLSASASEEAIAEEVRSLIRMRDDLAAENGTLKTENEDLKERLHIMEEKEKEARGKEALTLVDAAIRDGRLDAKGKAAWIAMFEASFGQARAQLEAIPLPEKVAPQIEKGKSGGGIVALSDMTFTEIVKADRLKELKKDGELYKQKFFEAYGKYPA